LPAIEARLAALVARNGLAEARARMEELLTEMSGPAFWDDSRAAEAQLVELGTVSRRVDRCESLLRPLDDLRALVEQIVQQHDRRLLPEATRIYHQIEHDLSFAELEDYFVGPLDWGDAYLTVQTAPGDSRAAHWAAQLVETYLKWCERRGFACAVVDEAPIDSGEWRTTLAIEGTGADGLLNGERGTHRFAEIVGSGEGRRQQRGQGSVEVVPMLEEGALRLAPGDVTVDTRTLHARGRKLRKLHSEVRAVYIPSGATVFVASDGDTAAAETLARALLRGQLYVERAATG